MTATLTFFSCSWGEISGAIGSRHRGLFRKILEKTEPIFEEIYPPEAFGKGPDIEEGLDRWIQGDVAPANGTPVLVKNLGDALGFLSLVQYFGQMMGSMEHTSSSGRQFRSFLDGKATEALRPPFSLTHLLSRSVMGIGSGLDIGWGGLKANELAELAASVSGPAPTVPEDPDADQWMTGLWNALGSGVTLGKDLITLYA